jgi:hypothetical protein
VARTYPADFLKVDRQMAKELTPKDAFVTDMLVAVRWMDMDGNDGWAFYNATADNTTAAKLGLLELSKAEILARAGGSYTYKEPRDE